jgi:molecular chaperone GrpE
LQRAAQHGPEEFTTSDWVKGMLAIERKLWNVLEQEGISLIDAKAGALFDPTVHEALLTRPGEGIEAGHIIEELERGYRHNEAVLRPARVTVAQ